MKYNELRVWLVDIMVSFLSDAGVSERKYWKWLAFFLMRECQKENIGRSRYATPMGFQ